MRRPSIELLYGEDGWIEHRQNGCIYYWDATRCMFSRGNVTERRRVGTFACSGEVVVDLYAGIGYFSVPYLKQANAKHLIACEWNPDAVDALRRNLTANGVIERCDILEGDNSVTTAHMSAIADRINLGLIPTRYVSRHIRCRP